MIRLIVGRSTSASRPTLPFSLICEVSRIGDKSRALLSSKKGHSLRIGKIHITFAAVTRNYVLQFKIGASVGISVAGFSELFGFHDLRSLMLYDDWFLPLRWETNTCWFRVVVRRLSLLASAWISWSTGARHSRKWAAIEPESQVRFSVPSKVSVIVKKLDCNRNATAVNKRVTGCNVLRSNRHFQHRVHHVENKG